MSFGHKARYAVPYFVILGNTKIFYVLKRTGKMLGYWLGKSVKLETIPSHSMESKFSGTKIA